MINRITVPLIEDNLNGLTISLWATLMDTDLKYKNLMRIRQQLRDINRGILGRIKDNVVNSLVINYAGKKW